MTGASKAEDGARDFDFLMGRWTIRNRRLSERLQGSTEWVEFASTCDARPLPGGLGNQDELHMDHAGGYVGMSFRFFNPATREWAIHWADNRRGVLDPPVLGAFAQGTGIFEGPDTFDGRPIRVRFVWSRTLTPSPRWEQAFSEDGGRTWETNWVMDFSRADAVAPSAGQPAIAHLTDFQVFELRRYAIQQGKREQFSRHFESFFPEAFQQLGALAFGQFLERGNPSGFTWLRGFKTMDARAAVNGAFYFGPVWKEHRSATNAMILDSDNVLLLRPLHPERGVAVLPAVDPAGAGARGVVAAQIFPIRAGDVDAFARQAEPTFAAYLAAGAREAGVLVTLDVPNNFPQHPVRTDGPFLVWLGILEAEGAPADRFRSLAERSAKTLLSTGLLRESPELVILDPTPRSRLRWLPDWT